MRSSETIEQLSTALSLFQGEVEDAAKLSENPHFRSKYADLATVLQTVRPVLSRHGLSLVQGIESDADSVTVTTRLMHKSGQWLESSLRIPLPKRDAQGVGNGSTYGRRYGAASILGISQDDDDGNSVALPKQTKTDEPKPDKTKPKKAAEPTAEDVVALKAKFDAAQTKDEIVALIPSFQKLTPAQQTDVQPHAAEARKRAGL